MTTTDLAAPAAPPLPLFDGTAFARRLQSAVAARDISGNAAAREARVDRATFSRAMNGAAAISHEHYLRLRLWLDAQQGERTAA